MEERGGHNRHEASPVPFDERRMRDETVITLRGYDSYVVRLGDELRGERASLGKSLLDVQRELKIKAAYIDAIENCDASVFPNPGFIAGYVRAYARYLGLDAETVYRRFCEESGFAGVNSDLTGGRPARGEAAARAPRTPADDMLRRSRFVRPAGHGLSLDSLSGLGSVLVLAGVVALLLYGGHYLLRDIQRIGIAPVNQAPELLAEPLVPAAPAPGPETTLLPEAPPAGRDLALREIYAPRLEAPRLEPRDGPIAAIDPESYGLYAGPRPPAPAPAAALLPADLAAADPAPPAAEPAPPAPTGVAVLARDSAWIRVFLADGSVVFERILKPGESYAVPSDLPAAFLRAGNAGAVYLRVGAELYGPLGQGTSVVRRVSLDANEIAASWPRSAPDPAPSAAPAEPAQSALLPPAR